MLVMGGIIGIGIFFKPQEVAALVPHGGALIALWVFAGFVALAGALTFAELGGSFPRTGGWYVFLREAFGPFVSFLFAWVVLAVISTGAIAVIASFAATQILPIATGASADARHLTIAASIIVGLTAITLAGIKLGAVFQNFCMLTKLIGLLALIIAGLVFFEPQPNGAADVSTVVVKEGRGVIAAFLPVFFAFGGWQHICYIAPELQNPTRTMPRAIVLGVCGVIVIYVLVNLASLRVLGVAELAGTENYAAEMANLSLGPGFAKVLRVVIAISAIGVCAVIIIVTPAIYVAMSREGLFFKSFSRLHKRTNAPVLALLLQAVLALGYLAWSHAGVFLDLPPDDPDDPRMNPVQLANSVVFAEWIFHGLVAYCLLRLRARRPELPRPFKSFLWPAAPVLYLLTALVVVIGNIREALYNAEARQLTLVGLTVLGVGALLYQPWRWLMRRS